MTREGVSVISPAPGPRPSPHLPPPAAPCPRERAQAVTTQPGRNGEPRPRANVKFVRLKVTQKFLKSSLAADI